jgi:peptidoglycan/LPS O-acetylase OafA/YrhL
MTTITHDGPPAPATAPSPASAAPATSGGGRLRAIDGLRFVAALSVLTYHYLAYGGGNTRGAWVGFPSATFPVLSWPASYGWLGVQLFFMISGFVICMSVWGRSLGDFFVSRVVRLYPAYWVAVLLTTTVLIISPAVRSPLSPKEILVNLTMLQEPMGIAHVDGLYWTLWVELVFYMLFAFVVWRGVTYRRVIVFCGVWLVASVFASVIDSDWFSVLAMPYDAPFFVAGIVLFLMRKFGPNAILWGFLGVCWLLAQDRIVGLHDAKAKYLGREVPFWPTLLIVTLCFAVLTLIALGRLELRWSWLTTLGALTYPLYLLHENIGWTAIYHLRHVVSPTVTVTIVTTAMILLAWLLHRFVERPVARWIRAPLTAGVAGIRSAERMDLVRQEQATSKDSE